MTVKPRMKSASIMRSGELLILLAAILYAFYPIVSVYALPQVHPFFIVAQIFAFYAVFNIVPSLTTPALRRGAARALRKAPRDWESFLAALIDALSHLFFFFALGFGSAIVASAVFETWPFFAMLTSFLFLRDQHRFPGPGKIAVSLLAVFGVWVLTAEPFDGDTGVSDATVELVAYALIASVLGAIASNYHNRLAILFDARRRFDRYLEMQFVRSLHFLVISALFFVCGVSIAGMPQWQELMSVVPFTLLIGGVIFFLVPFFFRFAIAASKDESIFILWYLSPIITVMLLWILGLDDYSTSKAVGSILIIVANIILSGARLISTAYLVALSSVPVTLAVLLLLPTLESDFYFGLMSSFSVVFTIVYGFIYTRLTNSRQSIQEDAFRLVSLFDSSGDSSRPIDRPLSALLNESRAIPRYRGYLKLNRALEANPAICAEGKFMLNRMSSGVRAIGTLGELMVVYVIGIAFMATSIMVRPQSIEGELVALLTTFACMYLLGRIIDLRARGFIVPTWAPAPDTARSAMPRETFYTIGVGDIFVFVYTALLWSASVVVLLRA